jgi:hypothetical protein
MAYSDDDRFFQKFNVTRVDGKPLEYPWFVLRYTVDPHARVALAAYANSVEAELPGLASDLRAELAKLK